MPMRSSLAVPLILLSTAACSPPPEPPTDARPEPQATQLDEAIRAPIRRAEAVEGAILEAAEKQRADIDAAAGG